MPRSLFVVFLLLLVCSISGYAERQAQQSDLDRIVDGASQLLFEPPQRYAAQGSTSPPPPFSKEVPTLSREFDASHLVGLGNGKVVAIGGATWRRYSEKEKPAEAVDFIVQDSSNDGITWSVTHFLRSGLYRHEYAKYPNGWLAEPLRAAFALVEGNGVSSETNPPYNHKSRLQPQNSIIRIVWMATVNDGFPKYWMSYQSVNVTLPLVDGSTWFVGFLGNTTSPVLTMKSGTLVFPVQLVTEHGRVTSAVLCRKSPYDAWNVGRVVPDLDTYNPAVVEWKDGELMMIAQHVDGYHRVYESKDFGYTWTESTGTLSRVWANSPVSPGRGGQNNFVTATIEGTNVILFAQSVMTTSGNKFYLWLTSNTRIHYLGLIETGVTVKSSTLLFKGDKLYCLYEIVDGQGNRAVLKDLTSVIGDIKTVLRKWNEQDKAFSDHHCCVGATCKLPNCRIPMNRLVGYLSGKITGDRWEDEYLSVDAVVSGLAARVSNGLTFKGLGAGAMWPVKTNGPVRPYHFVNYAFTLAAMVSIHEIPNGSASTPLLGVKLNDPRRSILLGVSYTSAGKWSTISKSRVSEVTDRKMEANQIYSVILTYGNGEGIVYIDGIRLSVSSDLRVDATEEISNFFFGAYSDGTEYGDIGIVTVANVTLFNRVLDREEITALASNKLDLSITGRDRYTMSASTGLMEYLKGRTVVTSSPIDAQTISIAPKQPNKATPELNLTNNSTPVLKADSSPKQTVQEAESPKSAEETPAAEEDPRGAENGPSKEEEAVAPADSVDKKREEPTAASSATIRGEPQDTGREGGEQMTPKSVSTATPTTPVPSTDNEEEPPKQSDVSTERNTAVNLPPGTTSEEQEMSQQGDGSTKDNTAVKTSTINTGDAISKIGPHIKPSRNKTIDGTVRVYGYVLPMLLLGLWAVATALP